MKPDRSLAEIHGAVLLFGLAGLFGKWLPFSPVIIVLGRVFFASLSLAIVLYLSGQSLNIKPLRNFFFLLLLGALLAVHWISFFHSIQISTVAIGLLSFACYPVFTAFLEPLFFKEKLIKLNIIYALLCLIGIFLIVPHFQLENTIYQGVLWGVFSGITFSILTILNRKFSQQYSSLVIAFYQDLAATLFLFPFLFLIKYSLNPKDIILLVLLGVFCTAAAHSLFIKGMRRVKAQTASIIHSLEPFYGIILAFLFLKEIPSLRTVGGGLLVVTAALAVSLTSKPSQPKFNTLSEGKNANKV